MTNEARKGRIRTSPQSLRVLEPETFDFATAINRIKEGKKVKRSSWPGDGDWIFRGNDHLDIHKSNGETAALIICVADIYAEDWIELPDVPLT